jgi:hypothetical protein
VSAATYLTQWTYARRYLDKERLCWALGAVVERTMINVTCSRYIMGRAVTAYAMAGPLELCELEVFGYYLIGE